MAGEFIKDPPQSQDSQARKTLRLSEGKSGQRRGKADRVTKSNGSVGKSVSGTRVRSGAASTRGAAF
jgi:hypothetical protein